MPASGSRGRGDPASLLISGTLTPLADLGLYCGRISGRMRKLVAKALGALVVCTFAPFDWVASIERAQAAEQLSGDMLKQNIPGAKIQLDTPLGSVIPVSYGVDGTLEGRAGAVAFVLGSQ